MSEYTADEVEKMADWVHRNSLSSGNAVPMLLELARHLRQEEEENRRDPVKVVRTETVIRLMSAASLLRIQVKERATFLTRTADWERLQDAMKKVETELGITKAGSMNE